MKHVVLLVGTRPNFVKAAPVYRALKDKVKLTVLHTGQHYTRELDEEVRNDFDLPIDINIKSVTSDRGVLRVYIERALKTLQPDMLVIFGDVNSTYAGAWAAKTLEIPIAHVESGLRSNDWRMEEEINRFFVDSVSTLLFVNDCDSARNLYQELNFCGNRKHPCISGNVMIDSLQYNLLKIKEVGRTLKNYAVVTLHRRETIEDEKELRTIIKLLSLISTRIPIHLYAHPHFLKQQEHFGIGVMDSIRIRPALGYIGFLQQVYDANFVITDSGGVQSEAAFLSVPCLVYRDTTEHRIEAAGYKVTKSIDTILNWAITLKDTKLRISNKLTETEWGAGHAADIIAKHVLQYLNQQET